MSMCTVLLLQSVLLPFAGTVGRCPGLIGVALSARSVVPSSQGFRFALPPAGGLSYLLYRGFALLYHLPVVCRTFLTGVSLCSTTCLWSVVPS